jgi:hypothetical protein
LREKLAAVLIIPSSWDSQLDSEKPSTPCRIKTLFWCHCRGLKKKKLPHQLHFPMSTWHQGVVRATSESLLQDLHDLEVGYIIFIINAYAGA